ncbi:MAG: sugar ABC transporter substrate-binding protein [Christensenella sp.]
MKKLVTLLLAIVMTVSLVACGAPQTPAKESAAAEPSAPAAEAKAEAPAEAAAGGGMIVYSHRTLDAQAHVAMQTGIQNQSEADGYNFKAEVCNLDLATQIDQIKTHISNAKADNLKALFVNPLDSDGVVDVAKEAITAGIPVICIDTPLSGGDLALSVVFSNKQCGVLAGEEVVRLLTEKYGEPKGTFVNVYGSVKSQAWRERKEGLESVISKYPNIKYVEVAGEGEMAKSQEALANKLVELNYEVDAVHAPSDEPCLGLAEALKAADMWKKVGEEGHVIFVSNDGEPSALKNIKDGYYDSTICLDCVGIGSVAVKLVEEYTLQGKEIPSTGTYDDEAYAWKTAKFSKGDNGPVLEIPPYIITSKNVDDASNWGNVVAK